MDKYYHHSFPENQILPKRWFESIEEDNGRFAVTIKNLLNGQEEYHHYDIIILATGFKTELPRFLSDLSNDIERDAQGRLIIDREYKLKTRFAAPIYMMNFSRHGHGVADPQTSLMSWRSAVIANHVLKNHFYKVNNVENGFLNYFHS